MTVGDELTALIESARGHVMTEEERRAQIISFAYGNCRLSNERITREMVERAYDGIHAKKLAQEGLKIPI